MVSMAKSLWALISFLIALCNFVLARKAGNSKSKKEHKDGTKKVLSITGESHPISVIIPALNEGRVLIKTIEHLFANAVNGSQNGAPAPKVIIVDATQSQRPSKELEQLLVRHTTLSLHVYTGPPSRGRQQNFGAELAKSPILLFLHADSLLPNGWDHIVVTSLGSDRAIGAFTLSLPEPQSFSQRIMLYGAYVRAQYAKLPYGDQAYFLSRDTFDYVSGFSNVPIMEDISLVQQIKRQPGGRVFIVQEKIVTSPRRWVNNGVVYNTILNQILIGAWMCGVSPNTIYKWYYGRKPS